MSEEIVFTITELMAELAMIGNVFMPSKIR